jgi:RimJ/RimL family protein N-acetyltransferase
VAGELTDDQAHCWAFTTIGTELIEWRCEVGDTASRRVAEKAGFLIEATLCNGCCGSQWL